MTCQCSYCIRSSTRIENFVVVLVVLLTDLPPLLALLCLGSAVTIVMTPVYVRIEGRVLSAQLYTSQVQPYFRAPHICVSLPGRLMEGRRVTWKKSSDVAPLAGRPLRLRFQLKDADLYALQFVDQA